MMQKQQIYIPLAIEVVDIQMEKGYAGSDVPLDATGTLSTTDYETGGEWK